MTSVRDLVPDQVIRAGDTVQEVHRVLMERSTVETVLVAQRLTARMAEDAAALSAALSDVEVLR